MEPLTDAGDHTDAFRIFIRLCAQCDLRLFGILLSIVCHRDRGRQHLPYGRFIPDIHRERPVVFGFIRVGARIGRCEHTPCRNSGGVLDHFVFPYNTAVQVILPDHVLVPASC